MTINIFKEREKLNAEILDTIGSLETNVTLTLAIMARAIIPTTTFITFKHIAEALNFRTNKGNVINSRNGGRFSSITGRVYSFIKYFPYDRVGVTLHSWIGNKLQDMSYSDKSELFKNVQLLAPLLVSLLEDNNLVWQSSSKGFKKIEEITTPNGLVETNDFSISAIEITSIRKSLHLPQSTFSQYFKISQETLTNWELGIDSPNDQALILLQLLKTNPKILSYMRL